MFLKRVTHGVGRQRVYWQLVESIRTVRGPRHRIVAYLGELRPSARQGWARLSRILDGKAAAKAQQLLLFEAPGAGADEVPDTVEVELQGVRVGRARDFGAVFLALALWRLLQLDEFFARELPCGREEVPWGVMACVLSLARFLEPDSELHIEDTWYRRTALADLLGVSVEQVNDTRLYRTLDVVLPLKAKLEAHLRARLGELFQPKLEILLYDVTSTYFEGLAEGNAQAQYGYSRDHRPDCKQVCIGLVVTTEGFPLGYEVFSGNRHDSTTVQDMVTALEAKYGCAQRVWVFDRGMINEENLAFIRQRGGQYVVGTPKAMLKRFEQHLLEKGWREVEEGVEVKLLPAPEGMETFVLCRSSLRREKEKAMHARFVRRIQAALERMQRDLQRAQNRRRAEVLERRIGRLLERNSRAARAFEIQLTASAAHPSGLKLEWQRVEAWQDCSTLSEGCYLLRSNITDQTPEQLWKTYIQLTQVEAAFRAEKSELRVRPIWHQLEHRVQAHILFSFLAYALWKTLQTWMERAGLGSGPRTLIEECARIKASDVLLRTSSGRDVLLCCVTRPDPPQRALLQRLGLALPERLGRPAWVPAAPKTETAM
jgi:transposase